MPQPAPNSVLTRYPCRGRTPPFFSIFGLIVGANGIAAQGVYHWCKKILRGVTQCFLETRPMIGVLYIFVVNIFLADPETRYTIEVLYLFF